MMDSMTRILTLAALLFISACNRQPSGPAPANEAAVANDSSLAEADVPSLEGTWTVGAIDGKPVGAASAMTASFAGGKASIASGCVRRGATYTQKGNMVSFAADPGGSANCEGRGTSAEHETAYAALQGASIAIFGKDGSEASLSGSGGNLTLRRR